MAKVGIGIEIGEIGEFRLLFSITNNSGFSNEELSAFHELY